jgi:hypothetical protein
MRLVTINLRININLAACIFGVMMILSMLAH